jgi:hypothetical protein
MRSMPIEGIVLLAALAMAAAPACSQSVRILVQNSPLAGAQYYAAQAQWQNMKAGDPLSLVREPDNPHDANAIRVDWQGSKLGYLPRAENAVVATEMDRGTRVEARIAHLRPARNPWQRVGIDIFVVP